MILLADENVDAPIVAALRAGGHHVDYVRDLDPGVDDYTVLALANADNALLLTSDKDFGEWCSGGSWCTPELSCIGSPAYRCSAKVVSSLMLSLRTLMKCGAVSR
jgi:hypothetical protein